MSPVIYGVHIKETEYTVPDDIAELLVQKDKYALEKLPVSYLQKAIRDPNVMQNLINFTLSIHMFKKGITRCKVLLPLSLYEKVVHEVLSEKKLTLSRVLLAALFLAAKEAGFLSEKEISQYIQDSAMYSTKRSTIVPPGFKKGLYEKIYNSGHTPSEYMRGALYRFISDPSFRQNVASVLKSLGIGKMSTKCGETLPLYITPQEYKKYKQTLEQERLFEKYGVSSPTLILLLLHMHDDGLLTDQEYFNYLARLTALVSSGCQPQPESAQALLNSASHQQSQSNNHHTSP
ncbi:MAG: hypothetical protein QXP36_13875 [Conexivisphaerales archaeon]